MRGKIKTADQLKEAITLRNGGYSLAAIAIKTGISTATLSRHFTKHGAAKGGLSDEAVILAREQLLNDAGFMADIKQQIAAVIVDDLSHFVRLREAVAITLDDLMTDKTLPAHYKARGLAALATTIRLSQEVGRKALAIDDQQPEQESIPELIITELTALDIERMRGEQKELADLTTPANDNIGDIIEEV